MDRINIALKHGNGFYETIAFVNSEYPDTIFFDSCISEYTRGQQERFCEYAIVHETAHILIAEILDWEQTRLLDKVDSIHTRILEIRE